MVLQTKEFVPKISQEAKKEHEGNQKGSRGIEIQYQQCGIGTNYDKFFAFLHSGSHNGSRGQ